MILTVAAFLSAFGLIVWAVGYYLQFTGMAALGALLVLGVGSMVMIDGLEHEAGEIETTAENGDVTRQTIYEPVETRESFSLGAIVTILSGVMLLRALNQQAEMRI